MYLPFNQIRDQQLYDKIAHSYMVQVVHEGNVK